MMDTTDKTKDNKKHSLTMLKIFRFMMENGYAPEFKENYILFSIDDNMAVLEYEEGILSVRIFFTIEKDEYDTFLEVSNRAMIQSFMIRAVILDDSSCIMFSCETICENLHDFRRFLPRMVELSKEGLKIHKAEMKDMIATEELLKRTMPAADERIVATGKSSNKLLS